MIENPEDAPPHSPRQDLAVNLMLVMPPILTVRRVNFSLLIMDTPAWALHLYDWHIREAEEALAAGFHDIQSWFRQTAVSIDRWLSSGEGIVVEHPFLTQRQLLRPWVVGQSDLSQYCLSVLENSEEIDYPGVDALLLVDEDEAAMFTSMFAIAAHGGDYVQTTRVTEQQMQMLVERFTAMLEEPT